MEDKIGCEKRCPNSSGQVRREDSHGDVSILVML